MYLNTGYRINVVVFWLMIVEKFMFKSLPIGYCVSSSKLVQINPDSEIIIISLEYLQLNVILSRMPIVRRKKTTVKIE